MTEFKIEKGVPIPAIIHYYRKYPFDKMEIGDSLSLDKKGMRAAYAHSNRHNVRFTIRRQPDGTYRCWRIE